MTIEETPKAPTPPAPPVVDPPAAPPAPPTGDPPPAPPAGDPPKPSEVVYDLKLPDGSSFDADFVKRTADHARALGLSNEGGQKFLDAQIAEITKATTAAVERGRTEAMQSFAKDWTPDTGAKWLEQNEAHKKASLADKEIGGSPEKLAASLELSWTVLRRFASPALIEQMQAGGFASNPEVVRFLARIGSQMAEGTLKLPGVRSGGLTEDEKLARRYPAHAAQLAGSKT